MVSRFVTASLYHHCCNVNFLGKSVNEVRKTSQRTSNKKVNSISTETQMLKKRSKIESTLFRKRQYQRVIEALHATVLQQKITPCILAENSYYIFIYNKISFPFLHYQNLTVALQRVAEVPIYSLRFMQILHDYSPRKV